MDIQTLFPTLVGIDQADGETIETIAREVLQQRPVLEGLLSPTWGDNVLSSFGQEKDLFTCAKLHTLKAFVEERKFGYQERHNHERGADGLPVSGMNYYNTHGDDGDFSVVPTDMQARYFGNYVIKPKVGRLVLFRSEVFHRVGTNMTQSDRISFSFNYLLKKNS